MERMQSEVDVSILWNSECNAFVERMKNRLSAMSSASTMKVKYDTLMSKIF